MMPKKVSPPDLPKYLRDNALEILGADWPSPGAEYDVSDWCRTFKNSEYISDLEELIDNLPIRNVITRDDVTSLLGTNPTRFVFGVYMWGNEPNAVRNARVILESDIDLMGISTIINHTKRGDIRKAYEAGTKIKGVGASYLSKLIYFVGRATGVSPMPLILDRHVVKALRYIATEEGWSLENFARTYGTKGSVAEDVEGYLNYIDTMQAWANQLRCPSAEYLEYFLFKRGQEYNARPRSNEPMIRLTRPNQ